MRSTEQVSTLDAELAPRTIRDAFGISRERMARLLDVSTRTIERWEERTEPPTSRTSRLRLDKLRQIAELGLFVYGPDTFRKFLTLPMPAFDGRSALQLIERDEADRVYGALAADYEGQGY